MQVATLFTLGAVALLSACTGTSHVESVLKAQVSLPPSAVVHRTLVSARKDRACLVWSNASGSRAEVLRVAETKLDYGSWRVTAQPLPLHACDERVYQLRDRVYAQADALLKDPRLSPDLRDMVLSAYRIEYEDQRMHELQLEFLQLVQQRHAQELQEATGPLALPHPWS